MYKMFVQTVSGPIRMGHPLSLLGADNVQIDITQIRPKILSQAARLNGFLAKSCQL
jgi:hypothetical protein